MGYWELFAFACASLGALTALSYALRPFVSRRTGSEPDNAHVGASISAGELEELIGRAVETANAPLHARLDALEEELSAGGHSPADTSKRRLAQRRTTR